MKIVYNKCVLLEICTFFSLISPSDIGSINQLTLKLKIICQYDVKHIMTFLVKINASFEGLDIHYY